MAVRTLIRISSPPSPLAASQPMLTSTLLELVRTRGEGASTEPLAPSFASEPEYSRNAESSLSEQAVMVLTLIDSLPSLHLAILEEWLPVTAETLDLITDVPTRDICRQRFWEVLSNGEMDVDRAALCVSWWSTNGGREMVLHDMDTVDAPLMSGGLGQSSKL